MVENEMLYRRTDVTWVRGDAITRRGYPVLCSRHYVFLKYRWGNLENGKIALECPKKDTKYLVLPEALRNRPA